MATKCFDLKTSVQGEIPNINDMSGLKRSSRNQMEFFPPQNPGGTVKGLKNMFGELNKISVSNNRIFKILN